MIIPGYTIDRLLHESTRFMLFYATRAEDSARVVIKFPKLSKPPLNDLAGLHNEFLLLHSLPISGVIKPLDYIRLGTTSALVREDVGAISLKEFAGGKPLGLLQFLTIACNTANTIADLHRETIIHKDLKPANILIHPNTEDIYITDFSAAARLPYEAQTLVTPTMLHGTFAYMSPEQTGRTNTVVDERTDLYSLGVTLYELLTGRLPFIAQDALELLYAHIAQEPRSPDTLRSSLPPMLSAIILKLLAKSPNDRYQTAQGLYEDLEQCRTDVMANIPRTVFQLGERDQRHHIHAPQKLYGREAEQAVIGDVFEQVARGNVRILMLSGYSGIGKTRLVGEVFRPLTRTRGLFISGKFDQLRSNTPYSACIQALRSCLRQVLSMPEQELQTYRECLAVALGANAAALIDVLPEIEFILGKQEPLPPLPSAEHQNRFNLAIRQFVGVFATTRHPLVLFLDDMQWADTASLQLLEALLDGELQRTHNAALLLILAYRSNEVNEAHPLMLTMKNITSCYAGHTGTSAAEVIQYLNVPPLSKEAVEAMVYDMLGIVHLSAQLHDNDVLRILHEKTGGNPFFLQELLTFLLSRGLLYFHGGQWQWLTDEIRSLSVADNVADLVADRLQKLHGSVMTALTTAAALGSLFDARVLLHILDMPAREVVTALQVMLQEGLILIRSGHLSTLYLEENDAEQLVQTRVQTENAAVLAEQPEPLPAEAFFHTPEHILCAFVHDRVQQAAYSYIADIDKPSVHRHIGLSLLEYTNAEEDYLFEIVQHLNVGLIEAHTDNRFINAIYHDNPILHNRILHLNARAAERARLANAYTQALEYAEIAVRLLPETAWVDTYDFAFTVYFEYAQCLYLTGGIEAALQTFTRLKERATGILDIAKIVRAEMIVLANAGHYEELLQGIPPILKQLGVDYTTTPSQGDVVRELLRAERLLWRKTPSHILALPELCDPHKRMAQEILLESTAAAYNRSQELSALTFMKMLTLGMKYGASVMTGYAMTVFAAVEGTLLGRYRRGLELAETGLQMIEHFNDQRFAGRARFNLYCLATHWLRHASEGVPALRRAYIDCLSTGDVVTAVYIVNQITDYQFFLGRPFEELIPEIEEYTTFVRRTKYNNYMPYNIAGMQMIRALQGSTKNLSSFSDNTFDETTYEEFLLENTGAAVANLTYYLRRLQALYICGFYDEAEPYAHNIEAKFFAFQPLLNGTEYIFYRAMLSAAQLAESALGKMHHNDNATQKNTTKYHRKQLKRGVSLFARWSKHCPENHVHKYALLLAETAALKGNVKKAGAQYDEAVRAARKHSFVQHEALASYRAARFYRRIGNEHLVQNYIAGAYQAYMRWGATAKAAQILAEFQEYFTAVVRLGEANFPVSMPHSHDSALAEQILSHSPSSSSSSVSFHTSSSSSSQTTSVLLDVLTVVKASQAISEEIVLSSLMRRMMRIVMESAGAQTAQFLAPADVIIPDAETVIGARQKAPFEERQSEPSSSNKKEQEFIIKARADASSDIVILEDAALRDACSAPESLLHYVTRTREIVVLSNACDDERFRHDDYVVRTGLRSALCLPLVHQAKLSGLLYMENNYTDGAFTEERVQLLQILATQMAVSLENALLYEQMEQKVHDRTRELALANDELRRSNEQLRLLDEEKNELLGMVSHDLKNPIGAIIINSEMMRDEMLGELPPIYAAMVNEQIATARRMEKILQNLLQVNALESGSVVMNLQVFDPSSILQSISEDYALRAKAKNITLHYHCSSSVNVQADEALLYQVFDNLISNALKYSPWNKNIFVEGAAGMLDGLGECFIARFRDEGYGISEEDQKRLFGKFARLSAQPTGNESSTGLGLSIVKKLVENMKGAVWCESNLGNGATFIVALPVFHEITPKHDATSRTP